ncbi:pyruvate formate lyase family protein, partial [Escherichia sp. R-CC3]
DKAHAGTAIAPFATDGGFDTTNRCVQVIRCGFGMPAFNNDEIVIPEFIKLGIEPQDAYDYAAIGCI